MVKLWIDELREAPQGWVWAKTITDAIRHLSQEDIDVVSLDYDISILVGVGRKPPREVYSPETFEPVARYIADAFESASFPIILHTLNDRGRELMQRILSGWHVQIRPERQSEHDITPDEQDAIQSRDS